MKSKLIILLLCVLTVTASCAEKRVVYTPPVDTCPLPQGYLMEPAVQEAEQTLTVCPEKFDAVFMVLLEIAKHKPDMENCNLLQGMIKRLARKNMVSERYAKEKFKQYFAYTFVTLPDTKTYNLPDQIDIIKQDLRRELNMKREGFIECCGDKEGYRKVEMEYARLITFLEDIVYNQDYIKREQSVY